MANEQNVAVRRYTKEFKDLMSVVFESRAYFSDFFGGGVEALDGISDNETAFSVKTSDIPVVVGTYDKTATKAFGTGTGSGSRFGNRTEVIYTNTDVPYTWNWAFHEGIDRNTVNNDFESAVADRLELQAQAQTNLFNTHQGKFISDSAAKKIEAASITEDEVVKAFNELAKYFVNIGAVGTKIAKVTPDVWNVIVDSKLMTTSKNSDVNIGDNNVNTFKGFQLEVVPDALFQKNECVLAYISGVGKAFTGIQTARTIESEDFDGVALQGAGKAGEYILPANKKAVAKVTVNAA